MLRRLGIADFLGAVIQHVEQYTELPCYEDPLDQASPFYAIDLVETEPRNTKTEFIDRFKVSFHVIAAPCEGRFSFQPVLELEQKLEEAMTVPLAIPACFHLVDQNFVGVNVMKKDPTNEGHIVMTFYFDVSYGYACK